MIKYILKQCKNSIAKIYGKWFAYPKIEETLNLADLSKHMASHNTPYSEGVIHGVLKDMVKCIISTSSLNKQINPLPVIILAGDFLFTFLFQVLFSPLSPVWLCNQTSRNS